MQDIIDKNVKERTTGSGITLTNNEIKEIINVIRSIGKSFNKRNYWKNCRPKRRVCQFY